MSFVAWEQNNLLLGSVEGSLWNYFLVWTSAVAWTTTDARKQRLTYKGVDLRHQSFLVTLFPLWLVVFVRCWSQHALPQSLADATLKTNVKAVFEKKIIALSKKMRWISNAPFHLHLSSGRHDSDFVRCDLCCNVTLHPISYFREVREGN